MPCCSLRGCWTPSSGVDYPGGNIYPLPWRGDANGTPEHCGPTQYYTRNGERYYFIEAEEYSRTNNHYNRLNYTYYYTYWVLQRPTGDNASGRDTRGAYIMHMPYPDFERSSGYGVCCMAADVQNGYCNSDSDIPGGPYPAPRVDYDFTVPDDADPNDRYYIWVRGQAPNTWRRSDNLDRRVFWGVDGSYQGYQDGYSRGTGYNGASTSWEWNKLNDTGLNWDPGETHTLNLWPSGSEFAIDRIAITTYSGGSDGNSNAPWPMRQNNYKGVYHWANGRTDWACNVCDPRFAGHPGQSGYREYEPNCDSGPNPDQRYDDLYDDEQPIRSALEAAKSFVSRLDPRFDQMGYVYYSSSASIRNELECVRRRGQADLGSPACNPDWSNPGHEPPRDPDCGCFPGVITDTVLYQLDRTSASGSTNIAGGMLYGINVLSTISGHYGRPGAAHVMIVMTDGRANQTPNSYCDDDPDRQWPGGTAAQDCVIYYAHEARNNSIVVYTITLGASADFELMEAVAEITGGVHRNADRPEKLQQIFDELYERIFLRLVE